LVRRTANHAGTPFADGKLGALTVNHFRRVGDSSAAGAYGHGLRFLFRHGRGRSAPSSRIWAGTDSSVSRKWATVGHCVSGLPRRGVRRPREKEPADPHPYKESREGK
jgi:hypothetical protein